MNNHNFRTSTPLLKDCNKDTHFQAQFKIVCDEFFKKPQSMKELSVKFNIDRSNICWYCRELRLRNQIAVAKKGFCPISKRLVNLYTTNPVFFQVNNQLNLF